MTVISSIVPLIQGGFFEVAINDSGEIAGGAQYVLTGDLAASWQAGAVTVLAPPTGITRWTPTGINASGDISGYAITPQQKAILWHAGTATTLMTLGGSLDAALALNNEDQVVGWSQTAAGVTEATLWQNGAVTNLGALPGGVTASTNGFVSSAAAINDNGQVVGESMTATGVQHAFLWQSGVMTDLGALTSTDHSDATAINNQGVIIGASLSKDNISHAVIWQNGVISELGALAGDIGSIAEAINSAGVVVGESVHQASDGSLTYHAVMWQNGVVTDLNNLLPAGSGWVLTDATGINDQGQIIGKGYFPQTDVTKSFELTLGSSAAPSLSAQTALQSFADHQLSAAVRISDSAAHIQGSLDGLLSLANAADLQAIVLSDPSTPAITLTVAQAAADGMVLDYISSGFTLVVTGASASVSDLNSLLHLDHPASVSLSDSAANVAGALDALQSLIDPIYGNGDTLSITLTDGGTPAVSIDSGQLASDAEALAAVAGPFTLTVTAVPGTPSIAGLSGHATTVVFSGPSSQYTLSPNGDGSFTLATSGSSEQVSGVLQLEFTDKTVTVAATNSFTEFTGLLYQGALGRTPDAGGLESWAALANALPASEQAAGVYALSNYSGNYSGTLSIASGFTNSAEFEAKYGSLTNAQFVTQLYSNILDRAPDSGGYNSWMNALTPVSQGGLGESREYVLVGFAESAEAISNATHGFTGQSGAHAAWLFLT